MSSAAMPATGRTWRFPKKMVTELTFFTTLIWLGFIIIVMAGAVAGEHWSSLDQSVWEQARQASHWFLLFMGVHIGSELLPQYITHGKTRRDFFIESGITVGILSAIAAVLVVIGWVIERVVYSFIGIDQTLEMTALFDSATDYPMIFLESLIVLAIWTLGGLYIASSWYRNSEAGWLAIFPALLVASFVSIGLGSGVGPVGAVTEHLFDPSQPPLIATLAIAMIGVAVLTYLAWSVIRTIPIRNVAA